jgi:hypothetical protein
MQGQDPISDNIEIKRAPKGNILIIESNFDIEGMYFFLKRLYFNVINRIFGSQDILLISINHTKLSFSRELKGSTKIKIGSDTLIINELNNTNEDAIENIINTIDFEFGNSILLLKNSGVNLESVRNVYERIKDNSELKHYDSDEIFCYSVSDGYFLYLVNTGFSISDVRQIVENTKTQL